MLETSESAHLWSVPQLDNLQLLRARFIHYAFKRHAHDYFVIGLIEGGLQKFSYQRDTFITPPHGVIIINPGEAHTGEAAIPSGFQYRALYPETVVMAQLLAEIKGYTSDIPFFGEPVLHDKPLFQALLRLHRALENPMTALEQESLYVWTLAQFIVRHADTHPTPDRTKRERKEIVRLRCYIEAHFAENITLDELATLVHWNKFYLLRVFRAETGLPPHAYLETVRVREAQRLLRQNIPLAQIALITGFNSQSHFTTSFKRMIGVTPGQYLQQFE